MRSGRAMNNKYDENDNEKEVPEITLLVSPKRQGTPLYQQQETITPGPLLRPDKILSMLHCWLGHVGWIEAVIFAPTTEVLKKMSQKSWQCVNALHWVIRCPSD
jgi:hypothetical protein